MKTKNYAFFRILKHSIISLGFTTIVGTLTNIIVLLVGYLISLPHLFDFLKGYFMNLDNRNLWFVYLLVSSLACMLGCFDLHRHIGKSDAMFGCTHYKTQKFNPLPMILSAAPGTALHGLLCALISSFGLPYLFIASPVQYIARFIAGGGRSLFADSAFDFPREYVTAAIFIYICLIFAASCLGYYAGHRRTIMEIKLQEKEKPQHPDKVWSEKDASQIPFAYRPENRSSGRYKK